MTCKDDGIQSNAEKLAWNDLFNGGCTEDDCWVYWQYARNPTKARDIVLGHCRESQATMVFMFLTAALLLVSGLLAFMRKRKGY